MTTDTPRTDAKSVDHIGFYSCATVTSDFARQLERELAISLENQCKSQAEVARLNNTLENTRISRDTIIEDRNLLDQELAASKAEVEHIKTLLKDIPAVHINTLRGNIATLSWDSYEHILGPHPCRDRAEKAEAEVAKLNHQLLKTESDLLQSQDINSFLDAEFRIACKRSEKAEEELAEIKETLNPEDK